jgi:hypothetical protein
MTTSESESRSGVALELAEEFVDRAGERPLKEYIDRHPDLGAEIREVSPAMAMMEHIALADETIESTTQIVGRKVFSVERRATYGRSIFPDLIPRFNLLFGSIAVEVDERSFLSDGTFQVHGNKSVLLDSEIWDQDEPLPAVNAHLSLGSLHGRVQQNHCKDCEILENDDAFQKTHDLIKRIAKNNGHGPYKWTWPKPSRKDRRRVDTEISHR